MEFANILREKRKTLHLTQQNLADQLHVTRQTLSRWENETSFPNLDTLVELSEILNISLDTLLKGENNLMVEKISADVREKKRLKRFIIALTGIFVLLVLQLCLLGYGRAQQIAKIDRFNPFLQTTYGYAVLPSKAPSKNKLVTVTNNKGTDKHKEWIKNTKPADAYVSNDPFGQGEWLKFDTGYYTRKNHWALVRHKGSYVFGARVVKKNQIPIQMREQAGNYYEPYSYDAFGSRVGKDTPSWWPFN